MKRLIALLLVLCSIVSLIPVQVFAVDTQTDPQQEQQTAESYAITYIKNMRPEEGGFVAGSTVPETFTPGTQTTLPGKADIVRYGYVFAGWYDNEELTGEPITVIGEEVAGDVVLYAKWDEMFYYITIPESVVMTDDNFSVGMTCEGFYTGDYVNVAVESENNWVLKNGNQEIPYKLSTQAESDELESGDEIAVFTQSGAQTLYYDLEEEGKYAGEYTDKLTFRTRFVGAEHTLSFVTNGGSQVEALHLRAGSKMTGLPVPEKDDYVFIAWCYDEALTHMVDSEDVLLSDFTLYAKYQKVGELEQNEADVVASALNQSEDFSVTITTLQPMDAATVKSLITAKNLNEVENADFITVTGSGTSFTVSGTGGFEPGASYKLTLNDNRLNFAGQDASVREYSFTIYKEEVQNVTVDDDLQYLPITDISNLTVNGKPASELSISVITVGPDGAKTEEGKYTVGTFTCTAKTFKVGDMVGLYEGQLNLDAIAVDDSISYIEITAVDGNDYTYRGASATDVLFTPDVLPIPESADTDGDAGNNSITVSATVVDYSDEAYAQMNLDENTEIDPGDFVALYTGSLADGQISKYGKITAVSHLGDVYVIAYQIVSVEEMLATMDTYTSQDVDGEDLVSGEEKAALEESIEQQAIESGFAEEAAYYLAATAISTDDFAQMAGGPITMEDVDFSALPMMARTMALNDAAMPADEGKVSVEDLEVKARIMTDLQHFEDLKGVRLVLEVSLKINVKTSENGKLEITLTGQFEQENRITINVDGEAVWEWAGIIPYIADYKVSASTDMYNFSGIGIDVSVLSKEDEETEKEWEDVEKFGKKIKEMLEKGKEPLGDYILSEDDASDSVAKTLGEKYAAMLEQESDWVPLFEKEIYEQKIRVVYVIEISIGANFVVGANLNLFLGADFWYENAKRYTFSLQIKGMDVTSDTITLVPEHYELSLCAMGTMGLRAGIQLELKVGLIATELASVGLSVDVGAYLRVWGYLYYRHQYTDGLGRETEFSGAMYLEFGIYLEIAFEAQVLVGTFSYNPTLYEKEWGLLSAGAINNYVDFTYAQHELEPVKLKRQNKTIALPDEIFTMYYMDMKEGLNDGEYFIDNCNIGEKFTIEITNDAFTFDPETKKITVTPKDGSEEENGEMIITYIADPLTFTVEPMQRKLQLHWDCYRDGYYIAFDSTGGSMVGTISGGYKEEIEKPADPVRQGYTFAGWYKDADLTESYEIPQTQPAEDIQLYAKWTPAMNTYKVEHYTQDLSGATYTLAATDTLDGMTEATVTGPVRDIAGFTAPSQQSIVVTADGNATIRYYYTRNTYTITFQPDNGKEAIQKDYLYGAPVTGPAVSKQGYDFQYWIGLPANMPAENRSYTAKWAEADNIPYRVEHYLQDADDDLYQLGLIEIGYGKTNSAVTATEHVFAHYALSGTLPEGVIEADGSLILKVYYDRAHYNLHFVTGKGTPCASAEYRHGATVPTPSTTMVGYGFAGWYLDETLTTPFDGVMPTQDTTLYAKWEAGMVNYTVNHYQQDILDDEYTLYKVEHLTAEADSQLTAALLPDYTGFTAPQLQTVSITADGSTVVDYYYSRNSYTVQFVDVKSGTDTSITGRYGAAITPPAPSRTGYTFEGWFEDAACTVPFENTIRKDITLTAKWTENSYTIYFFADSDATTGTGPAKQTVLFSEHTFMPENTFVKTGYTFLGWHYDKTATEPLYVPGKEVWMLNGMQDGVAIYYPIWKANTYTVTYAIDGANATGTAPASSTVSYDVNYTMAANTFTRPGYTFLGWSTAKDGTVDYTAGTPVKNLTATDGGNITFYPIWKANTYTIKFQLYGTNAGGTTASMTMTYDKAANLTANGFTKTGYTFVGWSTTAGGSKVYTNQQSVSNLTTTSGGTVTLYPVWQANTYTVSYNANGGSGSMAATTHTYDQAANLRANAFSRSGGYIFWGWSTNPSASDPSYLNSASVTNLAASGNVTLYAIWLDTTYTYSNSGVVATVNDDNTTKLIYNMSDQVRVDKLKAMGLTKAKVTWSFTINELNDGYQDVNLSVCSNANHSVTNLWVETLNTGGVGKDSAAYSVVYYPTIDQAFHHVHIEMKGSGAGADDFEYKNVVIQVEFY